MRRRSPTTKATAIRLKRQLHKGCFLIVEGRDDRLFFKRFVDCGDCRIEVADGKENVVQVVTILETVCFPGVIGVVDADLDHIEGNRPSSDNIIVHETVDLEALLIRSSALDGVLVEWGSARKIAAFGKDIRDILVATAVWIGCLRLYSHREELNLRFQGLEYRKCVNKDSLAIDIEAFVREVMNRSQCPALSCPNIVNDLRSIHRLLVNKPWLICYGKDMVGLLAFGLRSVLGTNKIQDVRPEMIKTYLRLSFDWNDLNRTKLSQDLRAWAARNSGFRVLRSIA